MVEKLTPWEDKQRLIEESQKTRTGLQNAAGLARQDLMQARNEQQQLFSESARLGRQTLQSQGSQVLGQAVASAPRTGAGAKLGAGLEAGRSVAQNVTSLESSLAGQRAAAAMGYGDAMASTRMQGAQQQAAALQLMKETEPLSEAHRMELTAVVPKASEYALEASALGGERALRQLAASTASPATQQWLNTLADFKGATNSQSFEPVLQKYGMSQVVSGGKVYILDQNGQRIAGPSDTFEGTRKGVLQYIAGQPPAGY